MAKEIVHEDFGEKIGGAKKDLWAARGLYVDDLLGMNEREADKYVKKDNVWKKPDYNALIQSGVPVDILYFRKVVRDSLNASPRYLRSDDTPEKRLARQKEYIATVRQVQEAVEKVQTVQEAMGVFESLIIGGGYCERISHGIGGGYIRATQKGRDNPVITDKLVNALYFRGTQDFDRKIVREAVKKQFGVPAEQKIPRGYDIRFNDGKRTYSKNNDWLPDTYYVTKGYTILKTNFATREEALKWVQDLARQRGGSGKQRFVPQQLSRVRRTGPDYRGKRDVIGQDYLDAFAFRGGEFGNWMTQNDRRASLNMGFDALKDLAAVLQISEKDISYQGTLSIAFGARGSGNAAAHYEPLRKVINLTKMHGAGSLAHEWWHGLDDYLGVKMGAKGFLSEHSHLYEPFKKLIETMKYKPETPEQAAARTEAQVERTRKNAASWLDSAVLAPLKRVANDEMHMEAYAVLREEFLLGVPGSVEQLNDFKKSVTGRVIPKSERDRLEIFERMLSGMQTQEPPQIGRVETDFYKNSIRMGKECEKDGGYWESNTEMTARAFACYIKDKLAPEISDYLAGHADSAATFATGKDGEIEILKAFPEGEERKAINAVFDEVFADLKREHFLTHSDHPQTLEETRPVAEPTPSRMDSMPVITDVEQLSLFGGEKPSILGQLAATKEQSKTPAAPKQNKTHEPEL